MQQERYDVVVVGSGIGGMCAGALLAHQGYKTMVVEKLNRIGGRCSTEEMEGFKLPTGAICIHPGAGMGDIFREVGVKLELIMLPKLYWRLGGKDYEMPPKGSISVMLDIINKLEVSRTKLVSGLAKGVATEKVKEAMGRAYRDPEKETLMFRDWLLQYTDNELAHEVFDCLSDCLAGGHIYETPASGMFAWFIKMGGARDVGVPPHGNIVEIKKLEKVIKNKGGDVWINCLAKRIVVERGKVKGVVVQKDGSEVEIASQVVISNTGPKATVGLAGVENFNEDYLRMLRLRLSPHPTTIIFVASDRPLWPENGEPAMLMFTGTRRLESAIPFSNISHELAPPGQHLLFLIGHPVSNFVHMNIEEEERQMLFDLNEHFPGWEKHGRILKIKSGDIDSEFIDGWCRVTFMVPYETPVKSLYNVGDANCPYGTVATTGAALGAKEVAEMVTKSVKPGKA